jgi:archaemetzincin
MSFRPPNEEEVRQAIGPLDGLPEDLRRVFLPNEDFEPIPIPEPNDWLAVHDEPGQTFFDFVKSGPNRPDAHWNTIFLQPLDDFQNSKAPPINQLVQFTKAFFAMNVEVLPPFAISSRRITTRLNPYTHQEQLLTRDILRVLAENLPENAFCVITITMRDLYPGPSIAWQDLTGSAIKTDLTSSRTRLFSHFSSNRFMRSTTSAGCAMTSRASDSSSSPATGAISNFRSLAWA